MGPIWINKWNRRMELDYIISKPIEKEKRLANPVGQEMRWENPRKIRFNSIENMVEIKNIMITTYVNVLNC